MNILQTGWPLIWLLLSDLPNKTPSLGLLLSVASINKLKDESLMPEHVEGFK